MNAPLCLKVSFLGTVVIFAMSLAFVAVGTTEGASKAKLQWGYRSTDVEEISPDDWQTVYPACNGSRQSPINIDTKEAQVDYSLKRIRFQDYFNHPIDRIWTVINNGHVAQFSANFTRPPRIYDSFLRSTYKFVQFHFHWGSSDLRGSEHRIDGKRYPLELHLVHQKVGGMDNQTAPDMVVIAVLFTLTEENQEINTAMSEIVAAVRQEAEPLRPVNLSLNRMTLAALIPRSGDYARYMGSMTTPPCTESVVWTVMREPLKVTKVQLAVFRKMHMRAQNKVTFDEDKKDNWLEDNFRPLQQINGRVVKLFTKE